MQRPTTSDGCDTVVDVVHAAALATPALHSAAHLVHAATRATPALLSAAHLLPETKYLLNVYATHLVRVAIHHI